MNILTEAEQLTSKDRRATYGHPKDNHQATADFWRTWIKRRYGEDVPFDARDVCAMNALQKLSRDAHAYKRDNWTDVCGYSRNVEIVMEEE